MMAWEGLIFVGEMTKVCGNKHPCLVALNKNGLNPKHVATPPENLARDVHFVLILPFTDCLYMRKGIFFVNQINKLQMTNKCSKCRC